MGLKKRTIEKAISAAFNVVGEIAQTVTYRRTTTVYVPGTGSSTKTNVDYPIKGILVGFSNYEIDRQVIQAFDQKLLVQVKDLTITPVVTTDTVVAGSKTYNIIRFQLDPSKSLYTFHLRAP